MPEIITTIFSNGYLAVASAQEIPCSNTLRSSDKTAACYGTLTLHQPTRLPLQIFQKPVTTAGNSKSSLKPYSDHQHEIYRFNSS